MYLFSYPAVLLVASFTLSHARSTVFIYHDGVHSYRPSNPKSDVCMKPKCVIAASEVLTSIDETVDPCDDFQRFACGNWIKRHELTEEQPEINIMVEMQNSLNRKLRDLLESPYESSDPPFAKMLKDYYTTCMDLDSIEKAGSEPLKKSLNRLGKWPLFEGKDWDESTFDWVDTVIAMRKNGFYHNIMTLLDLVPKSNNDTVHIIDLGAPIDILPDDSNLTLGLSDTKIAAYYKKVVKAAKLMGIDETTAEKELLEIVNFAIALQNSTIVQEESDEVPSSDDQEKESEELPSSDDDFRKYHTVKELQEDVPRIPWLKYLNGLFNVEVYGNDTLYVRNMDFLKKMADLTTSTEKRVLANYIMMKVAFESSWYLSKEWRNIDEDLEESEKNEEKATDRWKKCMQQVKVGMEKALSAYYVRQYFPDESKDEAMILMKYIHREFLKILEENDWMDEKTREKAEEKANALKSYIGYPKELLNDTYVMSIYENLTMTADSHFENALKFQKRFVDIYLSKFRMPMDFKGDSKFEFLVQVNAFYNPYDNSIGIPASILHDAFYEKDRPNYLNFGAIGYVMGHEITHGFDNRGRYFDKDGNKVNWWDKESDEHFNKKVACIIDQYDNYTMDNGMKVNGENTQNENIADNGGLKEAYLAYQSWIKDNGIEPTLPGLEYTQNQLFWLSAAHVWCSKYLPDRIKMKLLYDPHSPGRYRIIGPMSNLEEFSNDFNCSADSPMNRKYKCKVW